MYITCVYMYTVRERCRLFTPSFDRHRVKCCRRCWPATTTTMRYRWSSLRSQTTATEKTFYFLALANAVKRQQNQIHQKYALLLLLLLLLHNTIKPTDWSTTVMTEWKSRSLPSNFEILSLSNVPVGPSCLRSNSKKTYISRNVSFPDDESQIVTGVLETMHPWESSK